MVQSPSWEANWFATSQEISRISRNPKVHYRTHKRPPPISILGQPNPVHIPTSYPLEIHLNIIHPSTPRPPQWSLSLRLPHQDPIHLPLLSHTRYMPSPSNPSRFYHPHNIGWEVQNHLAPRYAISSIPLLPRPSYENYIQTFIKKTQRSEGKGLLKWIREKKCVKVWRGISWKRVEFIGGLFWIWQWTLGELDYAKFVYQLTTCHRGGHNTAVAHHWCG